ncbi:MAG: hypothetical protein J7K30_03050 [Deltaproteobacteria bacterium]|nr:hypothetical protein [Deltaproteobacteria bacterium]
MEILNAAGQPDLSIAGNGKKLYFLFHHNRKFYKKSFNAGLNKIISIPVKITDIIALLTGRIPILEYNTALLKKDPGSDMPVIILKNGKEKIIEKIVLDVAKKNVRYVELLHSKGSIIYVAAFDGIRKIKVYNIPTGFELSDDDAVVHINIDKYWVDIPVERSIFTLTP